MWLKEWRRRYFALKGNKLHFAKSASVRAHALLPAPRGRADGGDRDVDAQWPPQDEPHGTIDLAECLTVKSAEDKTGKPFSFEVATPDATYYMYAESEKQKDEWIGAIGRFVLPCPIASPRAPPNRAAFDQGHRPLLERVHGRRRLRR